MALDDVAVVGMGVVAPGVDGPHDLWELLLDGAPVFGRDEDRCPAASFGAEHLDPPAEDTSDHLVAGWIGAPPGTAPGPAHVEEWLRRAARQALRGPVLPEGGRFLTVTGFICEGDQRLDEALVVEQARDLLAVAGLPGDTVAARYPYAGSLDERLPYRCAQRALSGLLPGTVTHLGVDTACSSALYAIELGARAVRSGSCDVALCGGVYAITPRYQVLFSAMKGLSPTARLRALGPGADGTLFSDAAAVVALKRHDLALADGDHVFGVLRGIGLSSNGRGKAANASDPRWQRAAVERALGAAGCSISDVDWAVAHATGTAAGDRAELDALERCVAESAHPEGPGLRVTANKHLVGHTGPAAGALSLQHALLGLEHDLIPGLRGDSLYPEPPGGTGERAVDRPPSRKGLVIPADHLAWPAEPGHRRTAAVLAFGFGGTNACLLVSDPPPAPRADKTTRATARGTASTGAPVAVTRWATVLPDQPGAAVVNAWLAGLSHQPPPARFGPDRPVPITLALPGPARRAADLSQVLTAACAEALVGDVPRDVLDETALVLAMPGPTRASVEHALRCYSRDLVVNGARTPSPPTDALRALVADVRERTAPTSAFSVTGMMANVSAGRASNHIDSHGPNVRVECGLDSALAALHVAHGYVADGVAPAALVIGIPAAAGTPVARALGAPVGSADGAFGIALMRPDVAREQGREVLALLGAPEGPGTASPDPGDEPLPAPYVMAQERYPGCAAILTLLQSLVLGTSRSLTRLEDSPLPALHVHTPRR
ncbi:beta-ketoacyl synthase N-terminal-like domain-containing protein [Actinosynnema sp. NPDC053489]|uniref:beta-ketoacyl synthase N-terminal-like domain-containing protein n=1 Tax=Actinosynnema sp. NPDC053489 TaxID=3363916 RepID=UPI0037C88066